MSLIKILSKQRYKGNHQTKTSLVNSFVYGSSITPESSLEVSAFFRGLIYISTQIGKIPWDIKTADNQLKNDDDIHYLLNVSPNDDMSAFNWKVLCVQLCILRGNAFNEIVRDRTGRIVALIPILNHDVCMVKDSNGELFYELSNTKEGSRVYLRKDEMLHFRNIHTEDGINGLALINYARKALGISQGADKMAGSLFANSGLPSGTLETDGVLSPEVIERLKEDWKKKFGGNKAGGVSVLEQGMKFSPINFAPDVMQFLESRQFSVIEISRFLGVPPSKLYVLESQSYNNIEHSNLEVSNDTLDVWARNFEGEANMKLLTKKSGLKSDMDLYAVSRGDMDTRSKYFSQMLSNGAMTPNEIRRKEGLSPYEHGNEYYIATNNLTPISRQNEIIDAQVKSKDNSADAKLKNALVKKMNK